MISLDLTKSSEVRIAGDQPIYLPTLHKYILILRYVLYAMHLETGNTRILCTDLWFCVYEKISIRPKG